jgi:hypothetical protein
MAGNILRGNFGQEDEGPDVRGHVGIVEALQSAMEDPSQMRIMSAKSTEEKVEYAAIAIATLHNYDLAQLPETDPKYESMVTIRDQLMSDLTEKLQSTALKRAELMIVPVKDQSEEE